MKKNAIILTNGLFKTSYAKTAHGLVRGSDRFKIIGLIDPDHAGSDAGALLDGIHRNIPVFSDVPDGIKKAASNIEYAIVGVATKGGIIPPSLKNDILEAIKAKINIVSGLHQYLSDIPEIRDLAEHYGVSIQDIRKPKPTSQLHFWTGKIKQVKTPVIAVIGTDCALGKRTTARIVRNKLRDHGLKVEMIFTGQTGWLEGHKYGFILDSTLNDFVSGELEQAILQCVENENPDFILIEGQAALLNPSGPCGSEFIISGGAKYVLLLHAPARKYYNGWEDLQIEIPPLNTNLALINQLGAKVIGICINSKGMTSSGLHKYINDLEKTLKIPVILPLENADAIVSVFKNL